MRTIRVTTTISIAITTVIVVVVMVVVLGVARTEINYGHIFKQQPDNTINDASSANIMCSSWSFLILSLGGSFDWFLCCGWAVLVVVFSGKGS